MNAFLFSLVLIRKGNRFVLVQERKYEQKWYLPAGRVDPGETFGDAAVREVREEAGIEVRLTGLIRIEQKIFKDAMRMRALFVAEPISDAPLKSIADRHSLRAEWVSAVEVANYPLRGTDAAHWIQYLSRGGLVHPLSLLAMEGDLSVRKDG